MVIAIFRFFFVRVVYPLH